MKFSASQLACIQQHFQKEPAQVEAFAAFAETFKPPKKNTTTVEQKCSATTKSKNPCSRPARYEGFCYVHQPKNPEDSQESPLAPESVKPKAPKKKATPKPKAKPKAKPVPVPEPGFESDEGSEIEESESDCGDDELAAALAAAKV